MGVVKKKGRKAPSESPERAPVGSPTPADVAKHSGKGSASSSGQSSGVGSKAKPKAKPDRTKIIVKGSPPPVQGPEVRDTGMALTVAPQSSSKSSKTSVSGMTSIAQELEKTTIDKGMESMSEEGSDGKKKQRKPRYESTSDHEEKE